MSDYVIEMNGIEKAFSLNKVLHGVDFRLRKGSIHALLGENGTGKTTLMNILGGVLCKDGGKILVDGAATEMADTKTAKQCGIAFIHQELTLVNDLAVYENLFLGKELKKKGALDIRGMCEKSREILRYMQIDLDPQTPVRDLNASYKQVVEIARALLDNARIIIMDEPTACLTDVEVDHIFEIMRSLRKQGVSIVFISHKLNEVIAITDHYTVMRDGLVVADGVVEDGVCEKSLAKHMVGKEISYDDVYTTRDIGDVILEAHGLQREREYTGIDFTVRKGEIVGFTGLLGDGRSEIFSTIFGCNGPYQGEILVNGNPVHMKSTTMARKLGVSYVPRNRKENGIIKDLSVAENTSISILDQLKKLFFVDREKEKQSNQSYIQRLKIRVSNSCNPITSLSGGNQQKVVLAKALGSQPQLIILDNPTQGVDVGAKLEIYSIIMALAQQGVSFVILSSEAQEVLMLCDRMYVMYHGEIRKELSRQQANEETIMIFATGGCDR